MSGRPLSASELHEWMGEVYAGPEEHRVEDECAAAELAVVLAAAAAVAQRQEEDQCS